MTLKTCTLPSQRIIDVQAGKSKTYRFMKWSVILAWLIKIDDEAQKDLAKLDKQYWL